MEHLIPGLTLGITNQQVVLDREITILSSWKGFIWRGIVGMLTGMNHESQIDGQIDNRNSI